MLMELYFVVFGILAIPVIVYLGSLVTLSIVSLVEWVKRHRNMVGGHTTHDNEEKLISWTWVMWLIFPPLFYRRISMPKFKKWCMTLMAPFSLISIFLLVEGGFWAAGHPLPWFHSYIYDYVDNIDPETPSFVIKDAEITQRHGEIIEMVGFQFKDKLSDEYINRLENDERWKKYIYEDGSVAYSHGDVHVLEVDGEAYGIDHAFNLVIFPEKDAGVLYYVYK